MTLANIDQVNDSTRQFVPLREVQTDELIRELYDRQVSLSEIEMLYNCLDDYTAGKLEEYGMDD